MNRKLVMIFLYLVLATLLHASQGAVIRETNYRWRIDMVLPYTVITGQEGNFTVEEIGTGNSNLMFRQPDRITDINFDLEDPELLWASIFQLVRLLEQDLILYEPGV